MVECALVIPSGGTVQRKSVDSKSKTFSAQHVWSAVPSQYWRHYSYFASDEMSTFGMSQYLPVVKLRQEAMCSLVLRNCFLTFSQHCELFACLCLFERRTPSPSMQREALPDVAVKPGVEAEPEDQLETIFRCALNKVISIACSIPTSFKLCGSLW